MGGFWCVKSRRKDCEFQFIGMGIFSLFNKRERGLKHNIGYESQIHKSIYTHLESYSCWNSNLDNGSEYGGVYNLEYSPDG